MKITKSELKKLIIEELSSDPQMLNAINKLTNSIEDLDISIDYLSSAVTGDDPFTTNLLQKGLGRLARPSKSDAKLSEAHDGEGSMARSQLGRTVEIAAMLQDMIQDDSDLEEWVESKITKAQDYLSSVLNYMRGEQLSEGYYSKGKCVYKKDDNSKVGCTDGPVKDYLAALYANVDDAKEKK